MTQNGSMASTRETCLTAGRNVNKVLSTIQQYERSKLRAQQVDAGLKALQQRKN